MPEATNDLIYEVLKSMQARLERMDVTLGEVKSELQAIRGHQLAIQQDVSIIYARLGDNSERLDRIERRLGLLEPSH